VQRRVATAVLVLAIAAGREGAEGQADAAGAHTCLAERVCHDTLLAVGALVLLVQTSAYRMRKCVRSSNAQPTAREVTRGVNEPSPWCE
jgi:hypothetical protein